MIILTTILITIPVSLLIAQVLSLQYTNGKIKGMFW